MGYGWYEVGGLGYVFFLSLAFGFLSRLLLARSFNSISHVMGLHVMGRVVGVWDVAVPVITSVLGGWPPGGTLIKKLTMRVVFDNL